MAELDFWSRRKAGVEAEAEAVVQARQAEEAAALTAEQSEKSDEILLQELKLPDPDSLQKGDDFSAFMAQAVPDRLRRRALRRLWLADPALANLDGLLDYGEDFTDSATVIENMQTAYQVGKGMTDHILEMVRQAEEAAAAEGSSTKLEQTFAAEDSTDIVETQQSKTLAELDCEAELKNDRAVKHGDLAHIEAKQARPIEYVEDIEARTPPLLSIRRMTFHFEDKKEAYL